MHRTYVNLKARLDNLEVIFLSPSLVGLFDPANGVHLDEAVLDEITPVLFVRDGQGQVLLRYRETMMCFVNPNICRVKLSALNHLCIVLNACFL